MKAYLLFVVAGLAGLYIKTCEAGYCTESYSCRSTCNRQVKYKTSCGSWWGSNSCYKTRSQSYSCNKVCYRRVCCKGYTGTGCTTPKCFGSTTCPNGGKCVRPDYCTCLPGYASPRCSECLSSRLPTVPNGQYTQYSGLKSVAFLTCSAGYDTEGAGTVLCQSSGYWSSSSASCQPRSCCSLPSVSNGQFEPISNSVSLNAVAQLQCANGYVQFPASPNPYQIKCGTSGLWSPIRSEISCKLTECLSSRLPTVPNGQYTQYSGLKSVAFLTCSAGYEANGTGTVMCQSSGYWSSSSASCQPRSCCSLPSVSNGQFEPISNSVSLNAVAQLQCANGYVQFPASPNPYQIKCGTSGLWSTIRSEISCQLTDCGTPKATLNGGNHDIVNGTLFGNQAILTCNETHVLQGEPFFIQCQASGKWSSSSAICAPICPVGWIDHENSCYLFGEIELNYTDARQLCLENDATLVQVDSVSENVFLKSEMVALAENDKAMEPVNGYWNDLFEDTINGNEIWRETNTALNPTVSDWYFNQPDDYQGQQSCTMFWKVFKYRWADIECNAVGKPDKVEKHLGRALCERKKMVQG